MKVYQKKTTMKKQSNGSKRKTTTDCESIASGAMQHKVWRPGEQQQTTTTTAKDILQNKVWDPGGQILEVRDLEIMIILYLGSLMQEHHGSKNVYI